MNSSITLHQNNCRNRGQSPPVAWECALSQAEGKCWQSNRLSDFLNRRFINSKGAFLWLGRLCILSVCRCLILHSIALLLPLEWSTVLVCLDWGRFPMGLSVSKSGKAWTNQDKLVSPLRRLLAKSPHSTPTSCRMLITPLQLVHISGMPPPRCLFAGLVSVTGTQ